MRKGKLGKVFSDDESGVFELPVQYMVAIIVAAMAIAIGSISAYHLWKDYQIKETIKEVKKIIGEAEMMCSTAEEGTKISIPINFPSGMKEVTFGSSDKSMSNSYRIMMKWGESKIFYSSEAKFTGESNGINIATIYKGCDMVTLSLIEIEGEKYVKITPS